MRTIIIAAAIAAGAPAPGALKTYADWTVGCDNGLACTMASLIPEREDGRVTMSITRAPGLPGALRVAIVAEDAADSTPLSVSVDGVAVGGPSTDGVFTGAAARAMVVAIAKGRMLAVRSPTAPLGTVSLAGAAASLRYVDATQRRAGTPSAIVATGTARTVPPTPALPTVVARRARGAVARLTAAQRRALAKRAQCELPRGALSDPELYPLGGGATLLMLPCSAGAYNFSSALFIGDGKRFVPARVDVPSGFGMDGRVGEAVPNVVNGSFVDGVLASYAKGRGLADCGVAQQFAWDGTRFRLIEQAMMGECRGNRELITTWRARVIRR